MPVKIFFCYAHEDEALLNKIKAHLKPIERQGLITLWHDRDISAGTEWEREVSGYLNSAQIILLLVSADFINSDYCYSVEMQRAMERHEQGETRVIPIILRHVHWRGAPFGKLQVLPKNAKPLTSWRNRDNAFYEVSEGIRKVAEELSMRIVQDVCDDTASLPELEFSFPSYSGSFSGMVDKDVLPDKGKEDVFSLLLNQDENLFANDSDLSTSLTSFAGEVPSEFMKNRDLVQNTTSLTLEQVKSAWERVKKRVRGRNATGPKTAAYLNDFSIVSVEGSGDENIVVIQAAHTLHYEYMHKNNSPADVEWALELEFSQPCKLRLLAPSWKYPPSLTLQQVQTGWERVKKRVRGRNATGPKTAAYLSDYTVVNVESGDGANIVTIRAAHTLHHEYMHKNNSPADVEWALELEFSQPCKLHLLAPGQSIPYEGKVEEVQ